MRIGFRELIFFLVLLAVPVASFIYVFMPRNRETQQAMSDIEVKQANLDRLAEVSAKIDDLGLAIERGEQSIRIIEEKLPTEQHVDAILEQVWTMAEENGLVVKSVKSKKRVPAALYMELPLETVMEGDFNGFYKFMLALEQLPRITRVHEMKLVRLATQPGGAQALGKVKAEFTLSIYFESPGAAGAE